MSETHATTSLRVRPSTIGRAVRNLALAGAVALSAAACSDDDDKSAQERYCEAGASLESSVNALSNVDVIAEGANGVETAVDGVKDDVNELRDSATDAAADEVDALNDALGDLGDALGAAGDDLTSDNATHVCRRDRRRADSCERRVRNAQRLVSTEVTWPPSPSHRILLAESAEAALIQSTTDHHIDNGRYEETHHDGRWGAEPRQASATNTSRRPREHRISGPVRAAQDPVAWSAPSTRRWPVGLARDLSGGARSDVPFPSGSPAYWSPRISSTFPGVRAGDVVVDEHSSIPKRGSPLC